VLSLAEVVEAWLSFAGDDGSCRGGGQAVLVGGDVLNRVRRRCGRVDYHRAHFGSVDVGRDAEAVAVDRQQMVRSAAGVIAFGAIAQSWPEMRHCALPHLASGLRQASTASVKPVPLLAMSAMPDGAGSRPPLASRGSLVVPRR
jgi:hypothetical protein